MRFRRISCNRLRFSNELKLKKLKLVYYFRESEYPMWFFTLFDLICEFLKDDMVGIFK